MKESTNFKFWGCILAPHRSHEPRSGVWAALGGTSHMRGPEILARTISKATLRGNSTVPWQYHSRSDTHSKIACWTLLFDFLLECDAFGRDAERGAVGFGINHVMVGPINKTLDLVITRVPPDRSRRNRQSFGSFVGPLGIQLTKEEQTFLDQWPTLLHDLEDDAFEVAIAMEAKACMTEHVKSLPRLHAEILATGYLAKRAVPRCITASYTLVNSAPSFVTPSAAGKINAHKQPDDAMRVIEMIRTAVPSASDANAYGYDVVGVTTLECRNDGSPVVVVTDPLVAPPINDRTHYERMVRSLCSEYRARFGR